MSHSGEEAQASENYEVTFKEMGCKFFGEVDKSVKVSKMVVHAAHVPSCSNVRPHLSKLLHAAHVPSCSNVRAHLSKLGPTKQEERVAKSTAAKKRHRTEEAVETLNERGF